MPTNSVKVQANDLWIMSKPQDLTWIFGGAIASLLIPAILWLHPSSILVIFWLWIIIFDNTHLWSTYSRTYFDKEFIKERKPLIFGSLLFFFTPLLFSFYYTWNPNKLHLDGFLFLAQSWAIYHVIRQHYGYLSLYDRKNKTSLFNHKVNKYALFFLIGGSYIHFLFTHPYNRSVAGFLPLKENSFAQYFDIGLQITLMVILLAYLTHSLLKRNEISKQALLFNFICIFLYGSIFLGFAYLEPFYTLAKTPIQFFIGISIMISLFHDLQYHGLVWFYNRNKYSGQQTESKNQFGLASYVNKNFTAYCFFALVFSCFYGTFLWLTGEYPWLNGNTSKSGFTPMAFGIWWGFLFHHYYLDQKIWRVKKSSDLQKSFSITGVNE